VLQTRSIIACCDELRDPMLDSFGLEALDRVRCLALLGTARLGRVVFTDRGLPAVQPVRFRLCGDSVCFPAGAGSPLSATARNSVIAFEVDFFDEDLTEGWCVTVLGRANEDSPAGPPTGERWIRIPTEVVTGHRLHGTG
jgi:hypothetical protein